MPLHAQKRTHFRWTIIAILFFITIINYIDRASIGYAINTIAREFNFSSETMGMILGAFGLGYIFTTFIGGLAADKYGVKRTLIISTLFWGVATALTGLSHGFMILFISRIILGLAEGPSFPSIGRAISDWLPERERNRALSYALIAVPLSLAIGGPITSQLILLFTWRGTYFILAGISLLWIPVWWLLFRDNPAESKHVNALELACIQKNPIIHNQLNNGPSIWRFLLLNKTLLANNWAFFVFGFYLFFFMTWLPSYLDTIYHIKLAKVGLYTVFPWLLAAIMMWGVGTLSDSIFNKTGSLRYSRSYPILLSQLLAALCIVPITFVHSANLALLFISLAVGFSMCANAAFFAVAVDIAKNRTGTAIGIMEAVFALSGFLSPIMTGFIVSWSSYSAVFWLLAILALSSVMITAVFHNR